MYKSKLILLLKTFSEKEIKDFEDYVCSPYFNKNITLTNFYNLLKEEYPDFKFENVDKEIIYEKLFPEKKFNHQVMKNITGNLYKLCREFLGIEYYRTDKNEMRINQLRPLVYRNADPVYFSEIKKIENELSKQTELTDIIFHYFFQLEELKISFYLVRNEQPKVFDKVMKCGEYLIYYFHLNLAMTISNLNVNKYTFNTNYSTNLPEIYFKKTNYKDIAEYMNNNRMKYSDIFEMYYLRVVINSDENEESDYYKFKELLLKNITALGRKEIYGLFISLETYCVRKIYLGDKKFTAELFEIYNTQIEKGFYKFSENSPVTFMKFRNTCMPALRLKKFDWLENFISQFQNDVIESDRNNVTKIAFAQICFEKKEFEKVIELLAGLNPEQMFMKMDIRNLTLMSYAELGYTDSALSLIDTFRHFFAGKNSLPEKLKEVNMMFVNTLKSYLILKEKNQEIKVLDLKDKLKPFKNDTRIEWLIRKIESGF